MLKDKKWDEASPLKQIFYTNLHSFDDGLVSWSDVKLVIENLINNYKDYMNSLLETQQCRPFPDPELSRYQVLQATVLHLQEIIDDFPAALRKVQND